MVLDNLPAGEAIDLDELHAFTRRRIAKKGDTTTTARAEADLAELVSGYYNGVTTGTPLTGIIQNTDTRSKDYGEMQHLARPGHADYTGYLRYHGFNDIRGGGHFSGRLTAPLVLAGGICKQILERRGVYVASHILSIRDTSDQTFCPTNISLELVKSLQTSAFPVIDPNCEQEMRRVIDEARLAQDSVGGVIECCVIGLPAGVGSPIFDGIENVIRVLEDMEDQKFSNLKFVELNACNGGCVGGILTVENPYVAEVKLKRLRKYMPVARRHMAEETDKRDWIHWTRQVEYEPVFSLGDNMMESFMKLNQVERLCRKLPGLDCGSCGAPTCKALAEDIVRGEASETDCVYYLRENLHRLSEEVSILADDIALGNAEGHEMIRVLSEYIQRISDEMSLLDGKEEKERGDENDSKGTG